MATNTNAIKVISNTARDILQSAALFKSLHAVVWEYVANSLQYVDYNVAPKVVVKISAQKKSAEIWDNGSGMDLAGLQNFFTMHGHNQERLAGKAGRGTFGTGKAAAFAVADKLTVSTVRSGLRNTVTLSRTDIEREEKKGNVTEVPIRQIERNAPTAQPNGTVITIDGIKLKCDIPAVIAYIERHIGRGFKGAEVIVNGHEVSYEEPSFSSERMFTPPKELRQILGPVLLSVKVSPVPLDESRRGIDVTSNGQLLETTLGSVAGKEFSQYLFGELDVPQLAQETSGPNPAFNMARDLKLNTENALVQAVHTFISISADEVRRELVEEDRERRQTAEAQRLRRHADEIAKLLNDDFAAFSDKIERITATVSSIARDRSRESSLEAGQSLEQMIFGGDEAVEVTDEAGGLGEHFPFIEQLAEPNEQRNSSESREPRSSPLVKADGDGNPLGKSSEARPGKKPARGGFAVDFLNVGRDEYRAAYDGSRRVIIVNLDFPQVAEAHREGLESITFQRLAREIAITEYAIAINNELVKSGYSDVHDVLFEVRSTINRINRRAADNDFPSR